MSESGDAAVPLSSDAVAALYEQTIDEVYRYATRLTGGDRVFADEIVQETYLQLLNGASAPRRVDIGWLIVSCRHRFLDAIKRDRRRIAREHRSHQPQTVATDPAAEATDLLAELSSEHRLVLVMKYVDELGVADIAAEIGRSVHATESLLARARAALRSQLMRGEEQ